MSNEQRLELGVLLGFPARRVVLDDCEGELAEARAEIGGADLRAG